MGSPLAPILANVSVSHHEENWLNKCPIEFKARFYRKYVDDIFILFESSESAGLFSEYMSYKHQNINFTIEQENVGSLLFLEVKIYRKNGKFVTSVYRKPRFSRAFTNYESFIPTDQKRGLLHTLLHRTFSACCDFKTFHFEIDQLKTVLIKINYPRISCIRVLNHFLINDIQLNLWFRMYVKEIFLLSYCSWEVLRFKFEKSFKN